MLLFGVVVLCCVVVCGDCVCDYHCVGIRVLCCCVSIRFALHRLVSACLVAYCTVFVVSCMVWYGSVLFVLYCVCIAVYGIVCIIVYGGSGRVGRVGSVRVGMVWSGIVCYGRYGTVGSFRCASLRFVSNSVMLYDVMVWVWYCLVWFV